jgi:hypothetical protein
MIENSSSYSISGNCEFDLPNFMNTIESFYDDGSISIVSCGIHPKTKELIILTSSCILKELNLDHFFHSKKNILNVYPIHNGSILEFIFDDMIVTVDAEDILSLSKELQLMNLEIGMNHEDNNVGPEKNDQGRNGT